ncbi:hypothetical protein, partial [Pedobacter sp. ASV12]|uniref:hypothetical protein n=1 Tax=Pedobacter sp. ASV12 TaxID=2795120 RepID=UPI001E2AF4AE
IMNINAYDQFKNILAYKMSNNSTMNFIGYNSKGLQANIIAQGTNETSPKYAFESFEDFPNAVLRTGLKLYSYSSAPITFSVFVPNFSLVFTFSSKLEV